MFILGLTFAGTLFGLLLSVMTMLESSVQNYAVTGSFAVSTKFSGIFLNGSTNPSNMDFNISEDMVDAVLYIIKSDKVVDDAINDSGILNVSVTRVKNNITVTRYSDTQVVEMTLLWPNAEEGLILWGELIEKTNVILPDTLMMGSLTVIDSPKATLMGVGNTSKLIAVFMAVMGMAAGFAYAIMEMLMHPTLISTRDADEYFGIETIGTVPFDPAYFKKRQSMLVQSMEDSQVEQNYSTAAYILRNRMGNTEANHCFYVTSTIHGEGRTNAAACLAIQLADMEHKTLLIDLDLRNPMIGSLFFNNVEYDHSLNALYRKEINDIEAISNVSAYLDVLPAMLEHRTIMIDGVIIDILERLKSNYEYIVIDAPPVGMEAEALSLNQVANMALYIVGFDKATIPHIKSGLEKLDKSGIRVVGLLINEVPKSDQVSSSNQLNVNNLFAKKDGAKSSEKKGKKKKGAKKKGKPAKKTSAKKGLFGRKKKEEQAPEEPETIEAEVLEETTEPEPVVDEQAQEREKPQSKTRFRVKTIDGETGEAVGNASFDVVAAEDIVTEDGKFRCYADEVVGEIKCDADGNGESPDVFYGKYLLRQKDVPRFYGGLKEGMLIELVKLVEEQIRVKVIRYELTQVKVTVVDNAGNGILGAEFILKSDLDAEYVTDMKGEFCIQQLNNSTTYRLIQKSTLDNLRCAEETMITVDALGMVDGDVFHELTIVNPPLDEVVEQGNPLDDIPSDDFEEEMQEEHPIERQKDQPIILVKNKIRIHAVDKYTHASLPGAVLEVVALDDVMTEDGFLRFFKGEDICSITCNEDGFGESEELYLGTYGLREVTTPTGFSLALDDMAVNVEETEILYEIPYVKNGASVPEPATASTKKPVAPRRHASKPLPQEKPTALAQGDNPLVEQREEEVLSHGENKLEDTQMIHARKTIPDGCDTKEIKLKVLDVETNEPLSDAVFDIYAAEDIMTENGTVVYQDMEYVDTIYVDADGNGESMAVPYGAYVLREKKVAKGYEPIGQDVSLMVGRQVRLQTRLRSIRYVFGNIRISCSKK